MVKERPSGKMTEEKRNVCEKIGENQCQKQRERESYDFGRKEKRGNLPLVNSKNDDHKKKAAKKAKRINEINLWTTRKEAETAKF